MKNQVNGKKVKDEDRLYQDPNNVRKKTRMSTATSKGRPQAQFSAKEPASKSSFAAGNKGQEAFKNPERPPKGCD
jgi:hypothetical protein